ncbi:phage portal protein [Photorhabdus laumondii subsp. laumondii]|uniref:Phage portal protein n=1 Tax=Photorhabdus laumondii subsp. laumondii TaxID=141679 RepID=A0A6L9JS05_PHOLM|nr:MULTISPECIES: phage portal protein [Photorhabdus]AXG42660.1 phage portal protein [Photorhabdus laumondii subsp. laumondii]MCC8384748.1 phage portal protein [Photorhabdus laumondii]MCC8413485.1 phage portal protein [Photorhabdus laumondii]NDK96469.1 phage portal protein [Photorhabdus laumondii subsp. laumondii]NDL17958.1 phage portal protein [Photorhabdus laumondii subsp. laumondii]
MSRKRNNKNNYQPHPQRAAHSSQHELNDQHSIDSIESFSFGDASPVTNQRDLLDCMECAKNGRYYEPPIDPYGLARMFDSAVHHQSPIIFKRNVIMSCIEPHTLLKRGDIEAFIFDFLVFGNAYLELVKNRLGKPLALKHSLAKYTRRGEDLDQYWFVTYYAEDHAFQPGSVFHLKSPSIHQEIYGTPEYMAVMHSAMLNGEATLFRRNYYINGSHAGVIVYLTDPIANNKDIEKLKQSLRNARGGGAFKNLFVYAAGGKKDGLQILPFSQIAAKDEFTGIKDVTRGDMLDAHRVPYQLMGGKPDNVGGFGDIEKVAKVFAVNELYPIIERMKQLNDWLGIEVIRRKDYALAKID